MPERDLIEEFISVFGLSWAMPADLCACATLIGSGQLHMTHLTPPQAKVALLMPPDSLTEYIVKLNLGRITRLFRHIAFKRRVKRFRRAVLPIYPPSDRSSPFHDRIYVLWLIKKAMGEHYYPDAAVAIYDRIRYIVDSTGGTKFLI